MDEDSAPHRHPVATDGGGGSSGNSSAPCSPRTLYGDSALDRTKDILRRESVEHIVSHPHTLRQGGGDCSSGGGVVALQQHTEPRV